MMRHNFYKTLVLCLFSMIGITAFAYDCEVDGIYYNLDKINQTASVTSKSTAYNSYSGVLSIPEKVEYNGVVYTVVTVGEGAFRGSGLTGISIPNSVTSIGKAAFASCNSLTELVIPSSVVEIGPSAFAYCSGLTSINIPNNVTEVNDATFQGCSNLEMVSIGSNVAFIGEMAFEECSKLSSVTIPESVVTIAANAFHSCSSLAELSIGNGVKEIGYSAFDACRSLTSVVIPDNVISIGGYAFYGCSGLNKMVIGNGVTSIGSGAFMNCTDLAELTLGNKITSIESYTFYNCPSLTSIITLNTTPPVITSSTFDEATEQNATLHVLMGCKPLYEQAPYWKNFFNIQEDAIDGIGSISIDGQNKEVIYTINGIRCNTTNLSDLPSGIYIVNGKKYVVK